MRSAELTKVLNSLILHEVGLDLHDDEVALLEGSRRLQDGLDAAVVQTGDTRGHLGPVLGPSADSGSPDTAARCPFDHHPLTELRVLRISCEEPVEPLEAASVRDEYREEDLVLAVRGRLVLNDLNILLASCLQHSAGERKRSKTLGAEVGVDVHVAEADCWVQHLTLQGIWDGLRRSDSLPVLEERDAAEPSNVDGQVQHHCEDAVVAKWLASMCSLLSPEEMTLQVEADAVFVVSHDRHDSTKGKADPQHRLGQDWPCICCGDRGLLDGIQDFDLKGIPASLLAHIGPCPSNQALETTLGQRGEQAWR
mmetsp:Transcript_78706/g.163701  ORF Transcript_78706/g.163701 Transcript_78706/m.163701 type:complete len:310 (-) Transcript_78706:160-1089(-)